MNPRARRLRFDLRASCLDAAGFSLMVGTGETYLAAFALVVGFSDIQAGLLASVPPLAGALLQLISPWAVERLGSHKRWVVLCAVVQALSFVPLILACFVGRLSLLILFAIATLYWAAGLATSPAWNTWIAKTVPPRLRIRYFARRSHLAQTFVLIGLVLGTLVLHPGVQLGSNPMSAFVPLFIIALLARLFSASWLSRQSESEVTPEETRRVPLRALLGYFVGGREKSPLPYLLMTQLAVNIAGPYFTPFLLQRLELSKPFYVVLIAAGFVGRMLALPWLGRLGRRYGVRWLLWVGGIGIVPLPLSWLLSESPIYLVASQLLGGMAWACLELGSILLFFKVLPQREKTGVLTLFNLINASAMVVGSLLGALLLHVFGTGLGAYALVFGASTLFRFLALGCLRGLPDTPVQDAPLAVRVIAVRPLQGIFDRPVVATLEGQDLNRERGESKEDEPGRSTE